VNDGYVVEGGQDENDSLSVSEFMVSDSDPRHGKKEVHGLFHAVQGRSELACARFATTKKCANEICLAVSEKTDPFFRIFSLTNFF
jgi:hypothetical protein